MAMPESRWRDRFRRDPRAVAGAATLGLLMTAAWVGPWSLGLDPRVQADPVAQALLPPSAAHWLGTDALSRDVLARALAGAQVSLSVAALAAGIAFVLGLSWGVVAGWRGGGVDGLLMRVVDVLLAIPRVLLLLIVLGFWDERTPLMLGLVLGATSWMGASRLVRADVRSTKHAPWVEAARRLGASEFRIVRVHVLPVAVAHASVAAALAASQALILDAGLAAIGLGIDLPQSSWGTMLASAVNTAQWTWWLWLAPGVPMIVASAAFTAIADAARTSADPRLSTAQ
jgi:peptide/nickel transport system permease protein